MEADGRQVAFPTQTTTGGLELSRKVYVPASGPGFARFYNQVHNPGASPVTITLKTADGDAGGRSRLGTRHHHRGQLGRQRRHVRRRRARHRRDLVHHLRQRRLRQRRRRPGAQPRRRLRSHRPRSGRLGGAARVATQSKLSFVYEDVTVQAGGTVAYLSFEAMRADRRRRQARPRATSTTNPAALFTGLNDGEAGRDRRTGTPPTLTATGSPTPPTTARASATRTRPTPTGDTSGDVCDSDIDDDGIPNDVETAFGTNPFKADTDGDGVQDNADNCPKVAGSGADGCPRRARLWSWSTTSAGPRPPS